MPNVSTGSNAGSDDATVAFLTDEWVRALDETLAPPTLHAEPAEIPAETTVCYQITRRSDPQDGVGTFVYHLTLSASGIRARLGPPAEAGRLDPHSQAGGYQGTVGFELDETTARELAQQHLAISPALLAGRIRISGDPTRLVPYRPLLDRLDAALATLVERTRF